MPFDDELQDEIKQLVEERLDELDRTIEQIIEDNQKEMIQQIIEEKMAQQGQKQLKPSYGG